ncbi:MAG TPA: ABC transporter ATP-binding protein, partial [Gemmata sp.]|nr:ABC transporter ATP-binding protein [Gemmata sp.]
FSNQIDTTSKAEIQAALEEFVTGRTVFMITHDLPPAIAHRVLVMDAGRVVDVGTHEELLARCPLYQRLCDPAAARKAA